MKLKYKKLPWSFRRKYKYELTHNWVETVTIGKGQKEVDTEYLKLVTAGNSGEMFFLTIMPQYRWDGCSGPTIDTSGTMVAGLVHDALYQLMREGFVPFSFVDRVDKIFYDMLRRDGVWRLRAWYFYLGVNNWFAHRYARPAK